MKQAFSSSITRRSMVAVMALAAAAVSALAGADTAFAESKQTQAAPEKTLYERLGGVFAIAAVIDHFSDAVVKKQNANRPGLRRKRRPRKRQRPRDRQHSLTPRRL